MKINFYKFHGNGNDFIIIDSTIEQIHLSQSQVSFLCKRHIGIGADGLILLEKTLNDGFKMKYFNSDGNEGSMCGNGGRCVAAFIFNFFTPTKFIEFNAIDGLHKAEIISNSNNEWFVKLKMSDVYTIESICDGYFLNTGSPHFVKFVDSLQKVDVKDEGSKIRYNKELFPLGTNVNFVSIANKIVSVRTYERGVEDETLSCGTGVTASAIIAKYANRIIDNSIKIKALGGDFIVDFDSNNNNAFTNVFLQGSVVLVFSGFIEI